MFSVSQIRSEFFMKFVLSILTVLALSACSGGGGGSDDADTPSKPSSGNSNNKTAKWSVVAGISQDGCGERIDDVNQTFTVTDTGNSLVVNSGLLDVTAGETETGFIAGFQESNGDCTRSYSAEFSNIGDLTANVSLSVTSTCNSAVCVNKWIGTATKVN